MKVYRYESSKNIGDWTESFRQAVKEYESEKEPDGDENVKLVSIEVPDTLIFELEDESKELKSTIIIHDPDMINEDPQKDGYDFDYYAAWSDDVAKRLEK